MDNSQVKPFELPDWTNMLPNDSSLNARDMAEILGITRNAIGYRIKIGQIPEPDKDSDGHASSHYGSPIRLWTLGRLREFVREQKETPNLAKGG